jgi:hypothetical protein
MLKAIETRYKGYRFRSRLEARWAVFFDAMGVTWGYEKEGYNLGSDGYYLPDFWLPTVFDRHGKPGIFVEIKGQEPSSQERERCAALALHSQLSVVLFVGVPHTAQEYPPRDAHYQWNYYNDTDRDTDGGSSPEGVGEDNEMRVHWCSACRVMKVEFDNNYFTCPKCHKETCITQADAIERAVTAARSARFEHGEGR